MRIGSFNLLSYRHLPPDFAQTEESIWVNFNTSLLARDQVHQDFIDALDSHELAASLGFDMVGVNEHHSNGYCLMPSPNVMAGALARRSGEAALLILGDSLALYNPPQRVAEELAMLDCISGGKIIAGFPVGTPMDTCYAYGTNPSELRSRYLEAHDLIIRAWTSREPFSFNGRFNQQRYVNITPRPFQTPHPPIWVPGGGSVETWRFCAEHDYVYNYLTYFGFRAGEKNIRGFWNEVEAQGKPRNPFLAGIVQFVGVADSYEDGLKLYAEPAQYFFNNCLNLDPRWTVAPGYITEDTMLSALESQVKQAATRAPDRRNQDFRQMVEAGFVIVGSPNEVADKLKEIAISQNVGNILLMTNFGNMSRELSEYNVRRLATEVKPQIQHIFESDWEHPQWPSGARSKLLAAAE